MGRMSGIMIVGVILAVVGIVGLAVPVFTTQKTEEVAKIGDLKLQATEQTSHTIPPIVSGGVLALGLVLIGAGLYQTR